MTRNRHRYESCDNCGGPLPPTNRRYCNKPGCKGIAHLAYSSKEGKQKGVCEVCGGPLPRGHRKYCSNPACVRQKEKDWKKKLRAYWKAAGGTRRRPDELKNPYNPKPCFFCHKPLGRTVNRYFHPNCHHRMSRYLCGEEVHSVGPGVTHGRIQE